MLLFNIIISIIILSLFLNIKLGLSLYVAYTFLVPYQLNYFGMPTVFVFNLALIFSYIAYVLRNGAKVKLSFEYVKPFLVLYLILFSFVLFQNGVPFSDEYEMFKNTILNYLILPIILSSVYKNDKTVVNYLNNSILITAFVVLLYTMVLWRIEEYNPYVMFLSLESGSDVSEKLILSGETRLMARISSVFSHPMNFGLFLLMFLAYLKTVYRDINKNIANILLCLAILCVFLSGVRSAMVALFCMILLFLFLSKKIKLFAYASIGAVVSIIVLSQIPGMSETILSIFDDNMDTSGSSKSMRMDQIVGCFNEIRDCFFFGKGYSWTSWYINNFEGHPTMLHFESLFIVILCNYGIMGLITYIVVYFNILKNKIKELGSRDDFIDVALIISSYIFFSMLTGDYGYMKYWLIFYVLILMNINNKRIKANNL